LGVGDFVHTFGDCHLYNNHITDDIVYAQLGREPKALPKLVIKRKPASIFEYELDDFTFEGYEPHPRIVAPIAV
jgi:thymidylate synthase